PNLLTAEYNVGGAHRLVILRLNGGGISYQVINDFTDHSNRPGYYEEGGLRRFVWHPGPGGNGPGGNWPGGNGPGGNGPGGTGPGGNGPGGGHGGPQMSAEDCVPFNTANLRVVSSGNSWDLMDGSHSVASFGPSAVNANRALALIRSYWFTSQCFVS